MMTGKFVGKFWCWCLYISGTCVIWKASWHP